MIPSFLSQKQFTKISTYQRNKLTRWCSKIKQIQHNAFKYFLQDNIQYTTMVNVILIIDCNYLFLFCFYFASQWTGWATQPVYLLCPMYVYVTCNIDINISCIVPFCCITFNAPRMISVLLMFFLYCSVLFLYITYLIFNLFLWIWFVVDVKKWDILLFISLVISYWCTIYVLLELTFSWISSCLVSLFSWYSFSFDSL